MHLVLAYGDDACEQFAQLRRTSGETVQESLKLIMNRLLSNYVMSFMSLDGRSYGKMAFRSSPMPSCCW